MVSDGDSRTFRHLTEKKVYGDDVIVKEECINHVAKRMGTALRKLATQTEKAGVTLGGRGHGTLTLSTITKLTAYYGKAIRARPSRLDRMQNAVFATFNHAASTDDKPNRDRCPKKVGISIREHWLKANSQVITAPTLALHCLQRLRHMWKKFTCVSATVTY